MKHVGFTLQRRGSVDSARVWSEEPPSRTTCAVGTHIASCKCLAEVISHDDMLDGQLAWRGCRGQDHRALDGTTVPMTLCVKNQHFEPNT